MEQKEDMPISPKSAPICTAVEGNNLSQHDHANGAVACVEFSNQNSNPDKGTVPVATVADIAVANGKATQQTASDAVSCWSYLGSAQSLLSEVSVSYATQLGNASGYGDLFIPPVIQNISRNLHETTENACCSKGTSQNNPLTSEKAINMEEKDQGGEVKDVPAKKLINDGAMPNKELCDPAIDFAAVSSPFKENHNMDEGSRHIKDLNKTPQLKPKRRKLRPKVIREGKPKRSQKPVIPKPVQLNENSTGKRKYVRRKGLNKTSALPTEVIGESNEEMPGSAKMPCRRPLNFDLGPRDESSAGTENTTALLSKESDAVVQEANFGHASDLNASVEQSSNGSMLLLEGIQALHPSSQRTAPGPRPKENPDGRRVRRKESNKTSDPPTEVITEKMPDNRAIEECCSVVKENATLHLRVAQEMNQGLNPHGAKPKQSPTARKTYMRRKSLNKSLAPETQMAEEQTAATIPESKVMSRRRSPNSDTATTDESSAGRETSNVQISNVVEETPESAVYNQDIWMTQALYSYGSLPGDTQAPSACPSKSNPPGAKPKENPTGKRSNVRKKKLKTSPTEMTGELTEPITSHSPTVISCGRPLNCDKRGKDVSNTWGKNLTCNQNTLGKEASYNCMSLSEGTQAPSTTSKSNPSAEKLNANSVESKNKRKGTEAAEDGNISNSQITILEWLQQLGHEIKHSETREYSDISSMNLTGAHYNDLSVYQSKYCIQFPNIQKKRRTEKGKTSKSHIMSSMTFQRESSLACTHEDPQPHHYAPNFNCWKYDPGSAYNDIINNGQTFDEFSQTLRLVERSQPPAQTGDCNYLTTMSSHVEPDYIAKQLGTSEWLAFGNADRPQTYSDVLAGEMQVPCPKKKQNRKRSSWSRPAHSNTNEMQQHPNFALVKHQLPLGKSSDIAREAKWNTKHNVKALTEQFRRLNINTEGRDLVLYKQNALVPFQGSFDPIKKHRPRPRVDLDEETDRVWQLLMLDINHNGIDGTDEDKAKWWEEERNVFRGRADSFIARMHLVQGDRRFSRWKGSVLDSVIGVFLTQNVTDHLSSSAFMSLAARFPKKSSSTCKTYNGEGTSLVVNKQQVDIVEPVENTEWNVKSLNQSVYDQSSVSLDLVEHSGEKNVNSDGSCRTTSSVISLTDESNCRPLESSQRNIKEHQCPMVMIQEGVERSCSDGARKELNDIVSSQSSVISSQLSGDFSNDQNPEKIGSCSDSNSEDLSSTTKYISSTSFSKLLEMVSSTKFHEVNSEKSKSTENLRDACELMNRPSFQKVESSGHVAVTHSQTIASQVHPQEQSYQMQPSFFNTSRQTQVLMPKERGSDIGDQKDAARSETNEMSSLPIKLKARGKGKEKKEDFNWDSLRIEAQAKAGKKEMTEDTMDSLDWEAVRCADVREIADTIKERGMNNRLAERIKNFLNRLVEDHGSIDLEWLRAVPPDQTKEYLLSVRGLGLKSVECVRLLTLHHLAFPVDTNVGRIAVRLGWVPLQPLPESLQLHLLELYPVLESIQKYLWPRLCKLDQKTLYELHYQMITFGKVFCTKSKPNCNACPMRGDCRHFASAFASARLALPGLEQKSIVSTAGNSVNDQDQSVMTRQLHLSLPESTNEVEEIPLTELSRQLESRSEINICQPIIEEPTTPEPDCSHLSQNDMEDAFYEDSCEIPTIKLNMEEFTLNLQNYMQENMEVQEGELSKAIVALNPEAASIPMPKLKNVSRLRTEHCVYELPDTHPLLEGWDTREPDDPGKYLLAIWTPGETANSIQPPESKCSCHEEYGQLCNEKECFSCNSFREANSQIVRGTLLIPCRTAMCGSFPLNGTYFQVNEVFADHESSLNPVSVPRSWIWNLNRRTVYFGTSVTTIFKGLSTKEIQQCFWRGYVCVRGFDRKTRAPRPLMARLHFPASKLAKTSSRTQNKSANEQNPEH